MPLCKRPRYGSTAVTQPEVPVVDTHGAAHYVPLMPRTTVATTIELLKPVTWFAPMWALMCGVVSSGVALGTNWWTVVVGLLLAGPLVCGTSQAINDWFDRDVDRINEPDRPIPSGRMPGRTGLYFGIVWTLVSAAVAWTLGPWVLWAAVVGLVLAWAYSAPPIRLKNNGWTGNLACAVCYEGVPWFTGVTMLTGAFPDQRIIWLAAWYSLGTHGIMTFNDFKSVEGDRRMGIRSLPAQMGIPNAARLACAVMLGSQLAVVIALWHWESPFFALGVMALIVGQAALVPRLLASPEERAPWFNGTATLMFVLGMLVSAFAVRPAT